MRTFTNDKTVFETDRTTNDLSDAISNDLQNRGMTFVGSVIIYSYLQAIGVIYSHDKDCFLYNSGNWMTSKCIYNTSELAEKVKGLMR